MSRARGYQKHVEGKRGHRLVRTHGGAECNKGNCEINQPCDSKSMESHRKPTEQRERE